METTGLKKEYEYLYNDAKTPEEAGKRFYELIHVLRGNCPWDMEQTHESLRNNFLEETYEACDAIDRNDSENLCEELGDVMLQVYLHSEIASESKVFDIVDVINRECEKMIRRHPHIFADESEKGVDKILRRWENIKRKEHGISTYSARLSDVPRAFPALMRSQKVQKRAADAGFDWTDITGPEEKVIEELREFQEADSSGDRNNMQEELGDLLFSVVNVVRFAGFDAEETLNKATDKFIARFAGMEEEATSENKDFGELTPEEMDQLWNDIK
ncbi:MAG: nucleoside triphosphate pyrophosphohydrolase [Eubacterium sp.]|jgi:tetrapyrrole methylase family protein/MazG family protein